MIELHDVVKRYPGGVAAVDGVSLEVSRGETLVLLGSSGCGKTTTMKMINRLVEPTEGTIRVDGQDTAGLDPIALRRSIGYVIQHIGLFGHMTIAENVAIVPRLLGWPRARQRDVAERHLELVGLPPHEFADRHPHQLSGGQQQRVGVARALAADPPILLMDEPFGALDPLSRQALQREFLGLLRRLQKTVAFVTHDVFEAVLLGDRIALMDRGKIVQVGAARVLLADPHTDFVRDFFGDSRLHLELAAIPVAEVMEPGPPEGAVEGAPIESEASLATAAARFAEGSGSALPVVQDGRPVGVLSRDAVVREVLRSLGADQGTSWQP